MNLRERIHAVRSQALAVVKTGKITGGINAQFASYADIWSALQPTLHANGVTVGWAGATLRPVGQHETVEFIASMTMQVSDGAETLESVFEMLVPEKILNSRGSSVVNNAQRVANAESYCKRTALLHYFGMSAGNEDDVERMMPAGDQTNIPGAIVVQPDTSWHELTDGLWHNALSPDDTGLLGGRTEEEMRQLWRSYPAHPALCAWGADYVQGKMQDLGMAWADVSKLDAKLPEKMTTCTAKDLRLAAALLAGTVKPKEEGGQP